MATQINVAAEQRVYSPAASISNQMVRMLARCFGRGPTKARTTLNTNIAVVTLGDAMTRAEQHLVAAGEADAVRGMRRTLHEQMRNEAVAVVEEITGRKVISYMADIDTEANMAMIAFVFEPQAENGTLEVADVHRF